MRMRAYLNAYVLRLKGLLYSLACCFARFNKSEKVSDRRNKFCEVGNCAFE